MKDLEKIRCAICKHYKAEISNPVGWEKSKNKPESEGICLKLTNESDCAGIITTPDYRDVFVTSNFGCIHFIDDSYNKS